MKGGAELTAFVVADLSNLCKLLRRVQGALDPLVTAFEEHVRSKGKQDGCHVSYC